MGAVVWWSGRSSRGRVRVWQARATLVRAGLMGCAGVIAGLAVAAALVPRADLPSAPVETAGPAPVWIVIDHPLHLFSLPGAPYARLRLDYQARRRLDGSARQDVLTFGSFATPAPFLRLTLEHGAAAPATPDLVVTAIRIAGAAGIAVVQAGRPDALPSRFGVVAAAPMTLQAGGEHRSCLGFQLEGRPPVAIAGLACGDRGRGPDRAELACALDRLSRSTSGEPPALRAFFGAADPPPDTPCINGGPEPA